MVDQRRPPPAGGGPAFERQGEAREPDLLTPDDEALLDAKYDALLSRSEELVARDLADGAFHGDPAAPAPGGGDGAPPRIPSDEARRIADYAVLEEKAEERRRLNAVRRSEMLEEWERASADEEARVDGELEGRAVEEVLRTDGVAREILSDDKARKEAGRERARVAEELDGELRRRNNID